MPRQDGTGPQGKGPGTGRGLGKCNLPKSSKSTTKRPQRPLNRRMRRSGVRKTP
jgi:hypothetical protein